MAPKRDAFLVLVIAAVLILGPVPRAAQDEVFKHSETGKQTFVIKAEKGPNAAGIRRVGFQEPL